MNSSARHVRAVLLAGLCWVVLATRVFVAFEPTRVKVVEAPVAAESGALRVNVARSSVDGLVPPFALIARVRERSAGSRTFSIRADGRVVCAPTLRGGATHRIDCPVDQPWDPVTDHDISIQADAEGWSLEYLELATHHGNSTGILNAFILPGASHRYVAPHAIYVLLIGVGLTALILLPRPPTPRWLVRTDLVATVIFVALFSLILAAPIVSPYRIIVSAWTFAGWTCLLQLPIFAPWVKRGWTIAWSVSRTHEWRVAWALAVAVCVLGLVRGSRAVSVADTYGYVSEANLWLRGNLKIDQSFAKEAPWPYAAWTFAPLGYKPSPSDDRMLVPTYSPGLPIMLAGASLVAGYDAMFTVVPICAGLLIIATYGLGRRFASGPVGLAGAWLVATSPVVIAHEMSAMTDVPVAAAWTGAFYALLGTTTASAAAAGLLSGVATMIRPNLVPLTAVLALYYLVGMRDADERRRNVRRLVAFGIAALPAPIAVAAINRYLYGSPFASGYGNLADLFALDRIPGNLRLYLGWLIEAHTPVVLVGFAAILLPLRRLWPWTSDRAIFIVIDVFVVAVWVIYCAWLQFDTWYFTRFLLSSWPFIMIGVGAVAAALSRVNRQARWLAVCGVVALGLADLRFAANHYVFDSGHGEHRNIAVARLANQVMEPNSVAISMIYSGTLRYYAGRMTLNYAWIDGKWLDRTVEWLQDRGVHTYAVLEDFEIAEFRQRFAGARRLAILDGPPLAMHLDPGKVMIFDLSSPPSRSHKPIVARGFDVTWKAVPPVTAPRLAFRHNLGP